MDYATCPLSFNIPTCPGGSGGSFVTPQEVKPGQCKDQLRSNQGQDSHPRTGCVLFPCGVAGQKAHVQSAQKEPPGPISGEDDIQTQKGTCTPMYVAALFTIAKTWKQPTWPSGEEGRKM